MKKRNKEYESDFRKLIEQLARRHDAYKVFSGFCTLAACALAAQTREAEYLEEVKRWERDDVQIFCHALAALVMEMQERSFTDLLGPYYMDFAISHKSKQWGGEFHTPQQICDLMTHLICGDEAISEDGHIALCEPACGSGTMILSYAHKLGPERLPRLRVTAIDIKKVCCDMSFINTTLWGIPAEIIHGNALSLECFAAWKNIHWIFGGALRYLLPSGTPLMPAIKEANAAMPANSGDQPAAIRKGRHRNHSSGSFVPRPAAGPRDYRQNSSIHAAAGI